MSYKKFDQADLEVIKNIIKDDERILYAENINEEYSHAYENNIPVTKRSWNRSGRIFRSDRTRDHDRFKPHESYIRT